MRCFALTMMTLAGCAVLLAQGANPLVDSSKGSFERVKSVVLRSAEKVPEQDYSFRPVPEVRTFGEILGHIADAQYLFCGIAATGKPEHKNVEKTATTKAALTAALQEAFAYCESVYGKLTDAGAAQETSLFGRKMTRLGVMDFNIAHNFEHYGNLVTYMRMKHIVPPSSEKRH
ncbi:MAG: DinB family protein [Bryobacterales bacterium]|nr:DinB family protein [Bryobacterales bacterium]